MRRLTAAIAILVMVVALFGGVIHPVAAQGTGTTYTVQPGDNLYRIGLKFGISADALAKANGIVNANFVMVGQRLIIPGGIPAPTATGATSNPSPLGASTQSATASSAATTAPGATPGQTLDAGIISTPTVTSAAPPTSTAAPVPSATSTTAAP